jgi:hypothetical protein
MPDDVRYVISGQVSDSGKVNLKLPLRRFPKVWREKDFYKLPFVGRRGTLPKGFESQPFLAEHFISGARYVEEIFFRTVVNLDITKIGLPEA